MTTATTESTAWSRIQAHVHDIEALSGVAGLVQWDQQTYQPAKGGQHRAAHMSALMAILHQRLTDSAYGDALQELGEDVDAGTATQIQVAAHRKLSRAHHRASRVPEDLVRALAAAQSTGFAAWMAAREAEDFAPFAPALEELIRLKRESAACLADDGKLYDVLLQEYDSDARAEDLAATFGRLRAELVPFVKAVAERPTPPALDITVDPDGLFRLSERILAAMGFDLSSGRLDRAQHPFTVGIGPQDVRLTTHTYADDILGTLKGTIHEGGHGLYEQGLDPTLAGTGLMTAAGVGIHESQSRFWENIIGGSRPFCSWLAPIMAEELPGCGISADQLYAAANRVVPSLIRVKADEATYNLHIIVRFELERALVDGSLAVADLPEAWDQAYEDVVTVRPGSVCDGVLQDVHWSSGLLGYFPTYTVGNLMAASLKKAMERDVPDVWHLVGGGEFGPVLDWLRTHVHSRGATADPADIVSDVAGDRDQVADLMDHLRGRHGALVGL